MKLSKMFLVCALVNALGLPGFSQSHPIGGGYNSYDKFAFYYQTHLDPATPELANVGGGSTAESNGGLIHRYLLDHARRVYFGYDARVEVLPEPNTYRVTFTQLTLPAEIKLRALGEASSLWTQLSTPPGWGFATPRVVRAGEVLAIDLLTNGATGQRIVEYVTIQEPASAARRFDTFEAPAPRREFSFAPGPPRDFAADDAGLRIRAPRLSINGRPDTSTANANGEVAGPIVFIYVPNRGRFLLSLAPHPEFGFQKAGEVRGSMLKFSVGSETFSISAGGAIMGNDAAFNLYVLHEPTWLPTYQNANVSAFIMGAADRVEYLLNRR